MPSHASSRAGHASRAARRAPAFLVALTALAAVLLPACRDSGSSRSRLRLELEQARGRWADAGLTTYAVTQARGCFCPPPRQWTVVVENGRPAFISEVLDPGSGVADRATEQLALDLSMSVEELFDWIDDQLDTAGEIDATFDAELGYPTVVSVDPIPGAVDDEIGWTLRDVVPGGACTEIACTDAFRLSLLPPAGGFPPGDWTVTAATFDDLEQCSFRLVPGACGGGVCVDSAGCPVDLDTSGALVATLPPVLGIDPVGTVPVQVTVEIDGMEVLSTAVTPEELRSQPNGPLCPPVCWTAAAALTLP